MLITICSSASFNKQAVEVKKELEKRGFQVIVPKVARLMEQSGDYEVSHYKTWFGNPNDYHKKTELIRGHFAEVEKADAILVLNYDKHGQKNYIGGNTLMEMALALYLDKPIYVLNELPTDAPYAEEILGVGSISLHGKLDKLPTTLSVKD